MQQKEQRFQPNSISQPYGPGYCWHGVKNSNPNAPKTEQRFCRKLGAFYQITKGNTGIGICRMYLCDQHVAAMQKKGYTVERVR